MSKIKTGRKNTKNEVICQHAATLFREKGYKAASMRELADRIGVEAPSLYNHIGSKAELLQNICNNVANLFLDQSAAIVYSENTPAQKIETLLRQHIKTVITHFDEVQVANFEWRHLEGSFLKNYLLQRKEYEQRLVGVLKEGILKKEFRKTHPHIAALTLLAAMQGVEFVQKYQGHLSNKVLENNIVNQLINGITH